MARRGRPSKSGKRHPNGERAAPEPTIVRPSEWVAGQVKRYGQHYCWAMGRAYAAGLLGEGDHAKNRLAAAKRFTSAHRRFFGSYRYACPLDDSPRGTDDISLDVPEWQQHERDWLRSMTTAISNANLRPYLDHLITVMHADTGPPWLDRLLAGQRDKRASFALAAVCQALDMMIPVQPAQRITSAAY